MTETYRSPPERELATASWYTRYYSQKGADRNNVLVNRGVLFQQVASDVALLRALSRIKFDPLATTVLDVGGGSGGSLLPFMGVGAPEKNLTCVDIQEERISQGRSRLPGINFRCVDASQLPFLDESFGVSFASTMFVQIVDDELASKIAHEMVRVTRRDGFILIRDWTIQKPNDANYFAVTRQRIRRIFPSDVKILFAERGALVPPLGRFLSQYADWSYFLTQRIFPYFAALKVYVLGHQPFG